MPNERVGFVLHDDTLVEVDNIAEDPENGFKISTNDLLAYDGKIKASWHTHPGQSANLSVADYNTFLSWPHLTHYILGNNGIRCYTVEDGRVIVEDCSGTRLFEGLDP